MGPVFRKNCLGAARENVCLDWLTLRITFVIVHLHVQCDNRIGSCRSRKAHTCRADRAVLSLVWERVTRRARSALDQDSGRNEPPATEPRSLVTWWHIPDYRPEPSPADRLMRSRPGSHCSHRAQAPRLGVLGAALGSYWHERRDGLVAGLKPARRQGVGGACRRPQREGRGAARPRCTKEGRYAALSTTAQNDPCVARRTTLAPEVVVTSASPFHPPTTG